MKKIVKTNDENIIALKTENKDLKLKLQELQQQSNENLLENPNIEKLKKKIFILT